MTQVEVSIIVPAYNAGAYLGNALDRLLEQSHPNSEIVVVDDGSTDDTAAIASKYATTHERIRFLPLAQNGGVAAARKHAVAAADGEFIWFVDADDEWSKDAVAVMLAAARSTGADMIVAGAHYVSPDGRTRSVGEGLPSQPMGREQAFRLFLNGSISGHLWNKLFRRTHALGIDFTAAKVHSDQAMVAQLIAASEIVAAIDTAVYRYVLRTGSIIRSGSRRAESLAIVGSTVTAAARTLDLLSSADYLYYVQRFVVLSALKDATSSAYDSEESTGLAIAARRQVTFRGLAVFLRRRDYKRLLLAFSAKVSLGAYRRLVRRDDAHS